MALVASCAALLVVGAFALVVASVGHRLLRVARLEFASDAEHLLCAAAVGVIGLEVLLFVAQIVRPIAVAVCAVLAMALLFALSDILNTLARIYSLAWRAMHSSRLEKTVIAGVTLVLLIEGLSAMAPVTGSDALHYHFTAPLLTLRDGFHPNFFLSHSFFFGQSHLLILAGLALGSDHLAMGFLFLGGVLAAAATACLAHCWVGREWAWLAALVFLLTPVVFWQISSAGAPDLWMAFFATIGVVVISRSREMPRMPHAIAAGALAGGVAGAKYTGCLVAASMALAFLWEARSAVKRVAFGLAAAGAGIWPYGRNFVWSGDPLFPFLLKWISPDRVNAYALASYLADTGASGHKSFWQITAFPLFAAIDTSHLGFWQFLGPLVFAFAPLLILSVRNTEVWRPTVCVWFTGALLIGATSGMSRFLLPVLPLALAAVAAGTAQLKSRGWLWVHYVATASFGAFLLFGTVGLLGYERPALASAIGLTTRASYLREHAPAQEQVDFVNRTLPNNAEAGKALVFFRHVYYLRVPFLYGDPSASWAIDPSRYRSAQQWRRMFREQGVRWVVRSQDYPPAISRPLRALEAQGALVPVAQAEIQDFHGMRIFGGRDRVNVTILEYVLE